MGQRFRGIMRYIIFITASVIISLFCYIFYSGYYLPHSKAENLIVGTNAEYPPFSFNNGTAIVGFDIDVAREIGSRMNKKLKLVDMSFEILMPALKAQKIDLVAAGLSYTEERAKEVFFTVPYLQCGFAIISRRDNPITIDDVKNVVVTVNQGYENETQAKILGIDNTLSLPSPADSFLALKSKKADAYIIESFIFKSLSEEKRKDYFSVAIPNAQTTFSMACADKKTLQDINAILQSMAQDGFMTKLKKRWNAE